MGSKSPYVAVNLNLSQNAATHWASIASVDSVHHILTNLVFLCKQFDCQGECMYVFIHSDVVPKQLPRDLITLLRETYKV